MKEETLQIQKQTKQKQKTKTKQKHFFRTFLKQQHRSNNF